MLTASSLSFFSQLRLKVQQSQHHHRSLSAAVSVFVSYGRGRGVHVGARTTSRTVCGHGRRRPLSSFAGAGSVKDGVDGQEKPFFVTAPLFYPNAAPHIGHLHSLVIGDVFARAAALRRRRVEYVTGSDEHGLKIQQVAARERVSEEGVVKRGAERFVALAKTANVALTRFVRTSAEEGHRRGVEHLWNELQRRGLLYKGKHAGWYAVSDECFYTESQTRLLVKDGEEVRVAAESGALVEWSEEENWKFRLSEFRERLRERYEKDGLAIHPPHQHAAVLSSLSSSSPSPLEDLSVSRPSSRLHWGIRVPNDESQTMYVWVDALMGYLTGVGFPDWNEASPQNESLEESRMVKKTGEACAWPPDVQVIGKDIVRFHAIHLPAFLLALDLPLSRRLYAHAHWTVSRAKMSKSVGNVVDPMEAMKEHGVDVVRWYIVRVGGNGRDDVDWSTSQLEKHELELSGLLGNLLSRVSSKKILSAIPSSDRHLVRDPTYLLNWTPSPEEDRETKIGRRREAWNALAELQDALELLEERVTNALETLEISEAVQEVVLVLKLANKAYTEAIPWARSTPANLRLAACAWAVETLRVVGILLQPVIPGKASELLDALGVGGEEERRFEDARVGNGRRFEGGEGVIRGGVVLFPRREVKETGANAAAGR